MYAYKTMNKKEYKIPKIKSIDFVERDGLLQQGTGEGPGPTGPGDNLKEDDPWDDEEGD